MDKGSVKFLEKLGFLFEALGLSRSAGRIMGWLMLAESPQTLDDIAEGLQISKGSVSTNTRVLEATGFLEKVSVPGDRKVHYQMYDDVWLAAFKKGTSRTQMFLNAAKEGQELVPESNTVAHRRLQNMEEVYAFVMEETKRWIEELERRQKGSK